MAGTILAAMLTSATHAADDLNRPLKEFRPGAVWPDNHGVHINAHGGGVLYHHCRLARCHRSPCS